MVDPVSLTAISLASSAAGAGVGAIGSMQQGAATKASYQYKAAVAGINSTIAKQNEAYAYSAGETEAYQSGLKSRFQAGKIIAAQGASNIDVNSGSNVQVQKSQQLVADIDQEQIRTNAARKAYGYEVEAASATNEATLDTSAGENASRAGKIGALTSILGGVSSVSSKWLTASSSGSLGGGKSGGVVGPTDGDSYES